MSSPFPGARERGSADNEGPLFGEDVKEGMIRGVEDLVAKQVMKVILLAAAVVCGIGLHGVHCQVPLHVVDNIRWIVDASNAWRGRSSKVRSCGGWFRARVCGRCLCKARSRSRSSFGGVGEVEAFWIAEHKISRFAREQK